MGGSDAGDPVRARVAMDESMPEKFKFAESGGDGSGEPATKRHKKNKRKGGDHRRWRAAKDR